MSDGGEDGVGGIAMAALEIAAAEVTLGFFMWPKAIRSYRLGAFMGSRAHIGARAGSGAPGSSIGLGGLVEPRSQAGKVNRAAA
jgi:hypothetical protein